MMKIRRTLTVCLAAMLACAMLLSACGGGSQDKTTKGGDSQITDSGYPVEGVPKGPEDTAYPGP
jgi:ABC-type oligopeptide transport system substrate-binding subunit